MFAIYHCRVELFCHYAPHLFFGSLSHRGIKHPKKEHMTSLVASCITMVLLLNQLKFQIDYRGLIDTMCSGVAQNYTKEVITHITRVEKLQQRIAYKFHVSTFKK